MLETLITAAVMGLILTCVWTLFVTSNRVQAQVRAGLDLQQSCLAGSESVIRELSESNAAGVRWDTAPAGLVFASPRTATGNIEVDSSGRVLWRKWVCYYVDDIAGSPALVRKEANLTAASAIPPVPGASRNTAYFRSLAVPRRVVANHFSNLWGSGAEVHFEARREDLGGLYRFQLDTQVVFSN